MLKQLAVFRALNGGAVRSGYGYAAVAQRLGKVNRRLTAEACNDACFPLVAENVHDVLRRERLKIELVGGLVVRRDGFGVVVYDDGFKISAADGLDGVDGGIVELHALPDADGTCAEHDCLVPVGNAGLTFEALCVGGVKIGDVGAGVERIDHAEGGEKTERLALRKNLGLAHAPETRDAGIGEAHALCPCEQGPVAGVLAQLVFHADYAVKLFKEERGYHRGVVQLADACAETQQLRAGKQRVAAEFAEIIEQLFLRPAVEFRQVKMVRADFERAHALEQAFFKSRADAHDLARGLHLGAEGV